MFNLLSTFSFHPKVRRNGGVLSREDMSNYSVQVEQPVEGQYNGGDHAFLNGRHKPVCVLPPSRLC